MAGPGDEDMPYFLDFRPDTLHVVHLDGYAILTNDDVLAAAGAIAWGRTEGTRAEIVEEVARYWRDPDGTHLTHRAAEAIIQVAVFGEVKYQ
ncbi:MAG: hypothetical protein WAW85_02935 [Gordonia sp. (in: high G+C Gram-positive bacteria)]|uniref:hypothetical protein n=1 Tax=Gordonia sp. (in: high G+C Gram-positive bacteria) TaxID=84139 RepID=UPI003BB69380